MKSCRETCNMFKLMEIAEQVYKGQSPSLKNISADANRDIHVMKIMGGGDNSPKNPERGRAGKRKTKIRYLQDRRQPVQKKILFLHVPGHSYEECKVLKEYSKNYAAQWPHKDNGKTRCGNSVELYRSVKEANIMEHDDPIPNKKKGETG